MTLVIEFCGEQVDVPSSAPFAIGRDADFVIDENPFLHRRFLSLSREGELWWVANVGGQLAATLSDPEGLLQAWLAPGGRLPLTVPRTVVSFTAGATSYDLDLVVTSAPYDVVNEAPFEGGRGQTTMGRLSLTRDQLLLILVLAEPRLRAQGRGPTLLPSAPEAAERLGWTVTKFNRKLDNVCAKLAGLGVRGLHGDATRLASNRRARLVEYAVGARVVTFADLAALPVDPHGVSD